MEELDHGTCLVTGGAGFIGSHLCDALIAQGKRVVCLDNFVAGREENIEHLFSHENFELVRADVSRFEAIEEYFLDIDVVFHNAASKNTVCFADPRTDLEVNAWGTRNVAEAALRSGVHKVVHASTGSVYGEMVYSPQTEDHPLAPRSFYGTSKLAGENYHRALNAYHPSYSYTIIRYFHVYGSRQDAGDFGGVIPIFIRRAYHDQPLVIFGDGSQVRSFTYVGDDVEANIMLANRSDADGEVYNAASGIRVTVLELAQKVLEIMGKENLDIRFEDWRPGDIRDFHVDNSKARTLGIPFSTSFEDGLRTAINWYVDRLDHGGHVPITDAPPVRR